MSSHPNKTKKLKMNHEPVKLMAEPSTGPSNMPCITCTVWPCTHPTWLKQEECTANMKRDVFRLYLTYKTDD